MNGTSESRWPLGWKLSFFVPLAVALTLMVISRTQTSLHRQIQSDHHWKHLRRALTDRTSRLLDRRKEVDSVGNCNAPLRERSSGIRAAHLTSLEISSPARTFTEVEAR